MNPLSIYQTALDTVSAAVLAGDFGRYAVMIDLPYLVHTQTARILVTTVEDLRPTFDSVSKGLIARGVTHYERVAREADYAHPDRIEGWHHTHLIADGEFVSLSRRSTASLVRRGNSWLFSEAFYAIDADTWPFTDSMLFVATPGGVQETGT